MIGPLELFDSFVAHWQGWLVFCAVTLALIAIAHAFLWASWRLVLLIDAALRSGGPPRWGL